MGTIKFETGKKVEYKNKCGASDFNTHINILNRIASRHSNLDEIVDALKEHTPSEFKLGHGGSHIWCANMKNERIYIIEYAL